MPRYVRMVGIGGIGMSALAQLLRERGVRVSGSDREASPTTELLAAKGIAVSIGHDASLIPADTELVIYSDAVWEDNPERMRAAQMRIPQVSYFAALGRFSASMRTIAVTGTHGKTTTTGMIAKILQAAGEKPTAIVGSIVRDFGSNYLSGRQDLFVVEACEYKEHMLELSPEILVLTNVELDHTDFFRSLAQLQASFRKAVEKVPEHGSIVTNPHDPNIAPVLAGARARIVDYTRETVPALALLGEFNIMNARAAKAAALAAFPGILHGTIDRALLDFKGSWRRFEHKGETPRGALVYDDYAHHPTEVEKTIRAARARFPDKRIVVAFHPHLYSRTKSFLAAFASALAQSDLVVIAPIYAAREAHDPTVSHEILARRVEKAGGTAVALDSFDVIRDRLLQEGSDALIITMGAGDIYKVAEQITS